MMTSHIRFSLSPVIILTGLTLSACSNESAGTGGSGLIEATEVIVSAETPGRVTDLYFREGSTVSRGDTLLMIDPSRLELELASAEAGLEVARARLQAAHAEVQRATETEHFTATELERVAKLLASSTATQRQHDRAQYEHDVAVIAARAAQANVATLDAEITRISADIARLKRQLEDCYPTAPIGATVTEKYVERGELLSPGRSIARLARLDTVEVKVYLVAGDFAGVKIGDAADVDTEAGEILSGTVVWTADEAEFTPKNIQTKKSRADLVYAVKVSIANPDRILKVGMPVYVSIHQ